MVEMQLKLTFLGAAQNVTGSRYLLDTGSTRVLVDCGLFQEREFRSRNWEPFTVPPRSIDAVLLTHAHLDHCGLLPKLVRSWALDALHLADQTYDEPPEDAAAAFALRQIVGQGPGLLGRLRHTNYTIYHTLNHLPDHCHNNTRRVYVLCLPVAILFWFWLLK